MGVHFHGVAPSCAATLLQTRTNKKAWKCILCQYTAVAAGMQPTKKTHNIKRRWRRKSTRRFLVVCLKFVLCKRISLRTRHHLTKHCSLDILTWQPPEFSCVLEEAVQVSYCFQECWCNWTKSPKKPGFSVCSLSHLRGPLLLSCFLYFSNHPNNVAAISCANYVALS